MSGVRGQAKFFRKDLWKVGSCQTEPLHVVLNLDLYLHIKVNDVFMFICAFQVNLEGYSTIVIFGVESMVSAQ